MHKTKKASRGEMLLNSILFLNMKSYSIKMTFYISEILLKLQKVNRQFYLLKLQE